MAIEVIRKAGDTLSLKGTLNGDDLPPTPWDGGTARVNIKRLDGSLFRTDPVALDVVTRVFSYVGNPISIVGIYYFEIEVTYLDGMSLTFPNDGDIKLVIKAQIN